MKIKSLVVGMMACAALVACSNEDLVEGGNGDGNQAGGAKAYIGIKIADPTSGISRAVTDGGFDNGSSDENTINNSLFLFYKDGVYAGEGVYTGALAVEGSQPNGTSVEATTTAVVVLNGKQGEKDYPNQVVAFLNLPEKAQKEVKNKSLEEAMKIISDINDIPSYATNKNFIMTNSVYLNGNDIQVASPVTASNFVQSQAAALENPITIYVERVAAKVKMTESEKLQTPNITNITYNGNSGYQLKLTVEGWGINGVNKNTYLLKNLDLTGNFGNWQWNDANNFRSYWAKDANYNNGTYPTSFDNYNSETSSLEYRSWNDVVDNDKKIQYCPENTVNAALSGNINATTYMIIAGRYSLVDGNGTVTEVGDNNKLYQYIGQYYTEDKLLNLLANQANIYIYKNETWNKVKPEEYQLVRASLYDAKLELKATQGDFYAGKDLNNKMNVTDINEKLVKDLGVFTTFAGGKTFFYVNIEHLNNNDTEDGHIGIVRNHTYNLTLNSIKNIGNGVFDPDEDIIITDKDKEFYVGATLKILSWKVVNQGVDL